MRTQRGITRLAVILGLTFAVLIPQRLHAAALGGILGAALEALGLRPSEMPAADVRAGTRATLTVLNPELLAARGLKGLKVDDQVEIVPSAGEIRHEFFNLGIEAHEHKAAVTLHPRRRLEAHFRSIETVRVAGLVRHAYEIALIVEAPGMIETLQNIGPAVVMPANERASVRACVEEDPQLSVAAADKEKRPSRDISTPVVARLLYFGFVAQIEPALVEYPLLLHLKNLERSHGGAMNSKYALVRVVDDKISRVEHHAPLIDELILFHGATSWQGRFVSHFQLCTLRVFTVNRSNFGIAPQRVTGLGHHSTSLANSSSGLTTRGERPCS